MSDVQYIPVGGTLPTIDIPDATDYGDPQWPKALFSIDAISVEEFGSHFICTGNAKALIAAGIACADWFISDRKSWCITFADGTPYLRTGGRGTPKGNYIKIDTYCERGEYRVWVPITSRQKQRLVERRNVWLEGEEARKQDQIGGMTNDERFLLAGFRASSAERKDSLLAIARNGYIRQAAKPKYHHEGNIAFFPTPAERRTTA